MYMGIKAADSIFHSGLKLSTLEVVRRTSKMFLVPPCYISGVTAFGLWTLLFKQKVMQEENPCTSCMLYRGLAISFGAGVVLPLLSLPLLAHSISLREKLVKIEAENFLERLVLLYEYDRPLFRLLPRLFAVHLGVAAVCVYSTLWGWQKISQTMDVDPEFIREAVRKEPDQTGLGARMRNRLVDMQSTRQN
ncbi:hypothetical protein M3Y99_01679200 [Aphelenchoides fujianensis]|nr:hypothetical protein M3Y99_01679200 [Aphelenchoides fujianensis]